MHYRKKKYIDENFKSQKILADSIKMLEICRRTEDTSLRVGANSLLMSIEKDYDRITTSINKNLKRKYNKRT